LGSFSEYVNLSVKIESAIRLYIQRSLKFYDYKPVSQSAVFKTLCIVTGSSFLSLKKNGLLKVTRLSNHTSTVDSNFL